MLENYSPQAVKLIEFAEEIAEIENKKLIGTEHLLLAMFETEDTICHFLLSEEQITKEELLEEINMINCHSNTLNNSKFTQKFNEIIKKASETITVFNTKYVYDEHIFYTMLNDLENNATRILINLGLEPTLLIEDILDIFNVKKEETKEYDFLTNLTDTQMVHPYIERSNHIERIHVILNKKQKNNPLIIGSAGVGKTALVEGYAKKYPDVVIYKFELGSVMAGTKYRGELEEKIIKTINFIKEQKAILFIDEIHNIVGAGSNEGTLDIANILKPYISRSDIKCIGATTLDEYYKYFEKDKALMRRFQNIFIDEAETNEVISILHKIKDKYEEYHNIKYSDEVIEYIVDKTNKFLPNKTFPDKAIDVLDELGSRKKITNNNDLFLIIDEIIRNQSGIYFTTDIQNKNLNYEEIKPFYCNFLTNKENNKKICTIKATKDFNVNKLISDLKTISSFKSENYLEIDLETYYDQTSLNTLIGSSKGYIGYESGGILSEHLIKYPFSLVYFKNFNKAHFLLQNFIRKILQNAYFLDNKGRKINLTNVLIVVDDDVKEKKNLGIVSINKQIKAEKLYELVI